MPSDCNLRIACIPKVEVRQEYTDVMLELDDSRLLHMEFQTTREPALYRFAALEAIKQHLDAGEWTERDRVRLSFAFHMRFERRTRDEAFGEIIELVQRLPDREEQNYLAALILGFSARVLAPEQRERLRKVLEMTELLRELQEEFLEKGRQEGLHEGKREVAERMFRKGASVSDVVELTGLSEKEAEEIRKKVH
jgi:hypothetical protein